MHHRLAEVDTLQQRVAELEERLDFTERLRRATLATLPERARGSVEQSSGDPGWDPEVER